MSTEATIRLNVSCEWGPKSLGPGCGPPPGEGEAGFLVGNSGTLLGDKLGEDTETSASTLTPDPPSQCSRILIPFSSRRPTEPGYSGLLGKQHRCEVPGQHGGQMGGCCED